MSDVNVQGERSKLLNKHKKDRSELEKDVKKKKGAMKAAAQLELEQLEAAQLLELAEFDSIHNVGDSANKKDEDHQPPPLVKVVSRSLPTDIEWKDLSKKELQEECALRALSKGGGKEELVTRLICWAAERKLNPAEEGEDDEDSKNSSDEDSVSSSEEEEDIPDMTDEQKQTAEKQYKRELIVRKAIMHLFENKFPEGFPLDDLPDCLARIKVVNFKPESLGYATLHEFARKQPREAIFYDKGIKWLKPVRLRSDKRK